MLNDVLYGAPLDSDRLIAQVCHRTGLEGFDPRYGDVVEALGELIESVRRVDELGWRQRLLLLNELRLLLDRRARIELAVPTLRGVDRPVAPVFVVGLPRSGTTHLHRLLALHPDLRAPRYWELRDPVPPAPGTKDNRQRRAERELRVAMGIVPGYHRIHPMAADEPEECIIATVHSFLSVSLTERVRVPDFLRWLLAQDLMPSWRLHRLVLQVLDEADPGAGPSRRWALKAPEHLFSLDGLLRTYPDARIVWIHRDPVEVAPSACNLTAQTRRFVGPVQDPQVIGREWLSLWAEAVSRAAAVRAARPEAFLDVSYAALRNDPRRLLDGIRSWLQLPGDPHDALIAAKLSSTARPPRSHELSLGHFGLTAQQVSGLRVD